MRYKLILLQDGTGGRTITWPGAARFPGGSGSQPNATADSFTEVHFTYDGTNYNGFIPSSGYTTVAGNSGSASPTAGSQLNLTGSGGINITCADGTPDDCSVDHNINGLTENTSPASTDFIPVHIVGTGNRKVKLSNLVAPGPRLILIKAAGCSGATASSGMDLPTSGAPSATCAGTTTTVGTLSFADAATSRATDRFVYPANVVTVDVQLRWYANAASTNAARWSIAIGCVGSGGSVNTGPTYNTASAANEAYTGGANQLKISTFTGVDVTNCAADEEAFISVERIGADAGDTLAATAELLDVLIKANL
jgi:hypothetical protein